MVQGSGGEGLLLKTAQPVGVKRKCLRQNLDRHFTFETRITGAIDLAHAACAQRRLDFVRAEFRARSKSHPCAQL